MTKNLKLYNGRWFGRDFQGHAFVAAYSIADAARIMIAAGAHQRGVMTELKAYWGKGWGIRMADTVPERGIWIARGDSPRSVPQRVPLTDEEIAGVEA